MEFHRAKLPQPDAQSGQTLIAVLILMSTLCLVALGIVADYAQIWAHRQMAQAAADAACQAGAADLFLYGTDPNAGTDFSKLDFSWIGSDFNCSTKSGSPPCQYASFNGYAGSNVTVSFPASVPGATPIPGSFPAVTHPYIKVTVTDPVSMSLTKLVSSTKTLNVTASASCGLLPVKTPVPLVILHATAAGAMSMSGASSVTVYGGPPRSIQVDSNSNGSVVIGSGGVDLSQAGPNDTGADFALLGGPSKQPVSVNLGSTGHWLTGATPFGDPYAGVAAPPQPSVTGTATPVPFGINGCPDPSGCVEFTPGDYTGCSNAKIAPGANGCLALPYSGSNARFTVGGANWQAKHAYNIGALIQPSTPTCLSTSNAGGYLYMAVTAGTSSSACPSVFPQTVCTRQAGACSGGTITDGGVTWQNVGTVSLTSGPGTGIFDPGLYYLGLTGLNLGSNSTVRMSTAAGDGSKGVIFYFNSTGTVAVTSNTGKSSACTSVPPPYNSGTPKNCLVSYQTDGSVSAAATGYVGSSTLKCPNGSATPSQVPSAIDGNVLLGPCTGTYASPDGNRGFLFFQNRSKSVSASWGGGGQFLSSGFLYFHSGSGTTCGSGTSCLTMQGSSGAKSYTLGNVVVDELAMGGSPQINMVLNPEATFEVLRAQLLQ